MTQKASLSLDEVVRLVRRDHGDAAAAELLGMVGSLAAKNAEIERLRAENDSMHRLVADLEGRLVGEIRSWRATVEAERVVREARDSGETFIVPAPACEPVATGSEQPEGIELGEPIEDGVEHELISAWRTVHEAAPNGDGST